MTHTQGFFVLLFSDNFYMMNLCLDLLKLKCWLICKCLVKDAEYQLKE